MHARLATRCSRGTHEGFSLTWRVNVRTLRTSPNGAVISSNLSSGKLGGSPLMYTFGVRSSELE